MEKICWEMGRKNVCENAGGSEAHQPGVYPVVLRGDGIPGTEFAEHS